MIVLRTRPGARSGTLADLYRVAQRYPGGHALRIEAGGRTLTLGPKWACDASTACLTALARFGEPEVVERGPP